MQDEIDSIGGARSESSGGDSEVQRTMLELLNQLDGFEPAQNIKVLMATNRLDILDPALLRPGRIDRKIEFPNPNEAARLHIVKIHSRKMNLVRGINLKRVANQMKGASGAESKAVCTEAGMFALRERRVHVTQEDFEMAVAKVMKKDVSRRQRGGERGTERAKDAGLAARAHARTLVRVRMHVCWCAYCWNVRVLTHASLMRSCCLCFCVCVSQSDKDMSQVQFWK